MREEVDAIEKNMHRYKFDIDKLMSTATKLTDTADRQAIEITDLQKELAVV